MSNTNYTGQDRGDKQSYQQYLEAMDAISIEKIASASVFFQSHEGNTIVDVGMASGTSTAILSNLFPQQHIIGVDINPKMVDIAKNTYQASNLSFRIDDGERLESIDTNTVDGFFNCSAIHHITSYNNYDINRAYNTLRRQTDLLKDRGIIVVRDFLKPQQEEVVIELSAKDRTDRPNDCDLLLQFAKTARSLAPKTERGFPIEELSSNKKGIRRFKLYNTDAVEFVRRKDYYANWDIELQEEYGYFTQREFEECFKSLGLRIILSAPIYNQWIINNRYKDQFKLYDLSGKEKGFPPTNYIIVGEKTTSGKQLNLVRHLYLPDNSFLRYSSYINKLDNQVYDVVSRPNDVKDIIPYYYRGENQLTILAKQGYPRPIINAAESYPLDGKTFGGYITEAVTLATEGDIVEVLADRFSIANIDMVEPLITYFTSPGGIDEQVSSYSLAIKEDVNRAIKLTSGYSGFKESGYIQAYDAAQILNTAQTGALVEARLEMNIYQLFYQQNIPLPKWLGEKIRPSFHRFIKPSRLSNLLSEQRQDYEKCAEKANFLTTRRALFSESEADNSSAILEYVYPSVLSSNTLITLPVFRMNGQIYVGLEKRSLPIPQLHTGNSLLLTVPAKRLPKSVQSLHDLQSYISEMKIGRTKIERCFKLGEKYYPSIGITPEQVYPFVVTLDKADKSLEWVSLEDLYLNIHNLKDAHLLICISRLIHALDIFQKWKIKNFSLEDLVDFIKDCFSFTNKEITRESLLERDLGITGDDGDELLLAIMDEFSIEFRDEKDSIRDAFELKDDEYLFHGEGWSISGLFIKENIKPLTVGQLYDVMQKMSKNSRTTERVP